MGWAKRVDGNQKDIVRTFKQLGCTVEDLSKVGKGCPDLLVGVAGINVLVECKSGKGKLNKGQVEWHGEWRGQVVVARSVEDAISIAGVARTLGGR